MKIPVKDYFKEMRGIFSCAVFCVYSWVLLIFFWDLPAFLFYLSVGDIVGYLAYQFMFALGESVIVTFFITALIFIIPARRIKSNISVVGALLVFSFAIVSIIFKELGGIADWFKQTFSMNGSTAILVSAGIWIFSILALPILSIALANKSKISGFVKNFIDNLFVLVVLYVFLSVMSMALVIYRNIQ